HRSGIVILPAVLQKRHRQFICAIQFSDDRTRSPCGLLILRLLRKFVPRSSGAASSETSVSEPRRRAPRPEAISEDEDFGGVLEKARALDAGGQYPVSLAMVDAALAATPEHPALLFARASTLFEWGRYAEALAGYLRVSQLDAAMNLLDLQLGWSCFYARRVEDAELWMRKAIGGTTDPWKAHFGLAAVLQTRGKHDEAISCFQRGLEI